jgi:hypothetical protein
MINIRKIKLSVICCLFFTFFIWGGFSLLIIYSSSFASSSNSIICIKYINYAINTWLFLWQLKNWQDLKKIFNEIP